MELCTLYMLLAFNTGRMMTPAFLTFAFVRSTAILANTGHSPNAVSMLAHRLRRWSNIETALGEGHVFVPLSKNLTKNDIFNYFSEEKIHRASHATTPYLGLLLMSWS